MRVRLLFYCPRCGSLLFRPSNSRARKDSLLRAFGVHPHRCQMCRLRFYLFKPIRLRSILFLPDRQFDPQPTGLQPDVAAGNSPLMTWELLRDASDSHHRP
jgi:hypothetical protein